MIAADGFESHIPTMLFPERRHIVALEFVPPEADIEAASREWAQDLAKGSEEYLLVFKIDAMHFKIVRHVAGSFEDGVFSVPDA